MTTPSTGGDYILENGILKKVGYSTDETTQNPELLTLVVTQTKAINDIKAQPIADVIVSTNKEN